MVISDIIIMGTSSAYSKEYSIKKARIIQGKSITDFYGDDYRFLSAYEGVVYQIYPRAREQYDYDHEFFDLAGDSSLRIIWLERDLKKKILEIIHDMLMTICAPVIFLVHLQGYDESVVHLNSSTFEKKMMDESLTFNTAYVIAN